MLSQKILFRSVLCLFMIAQFAGCSRKTIKDGSAEKVVVIDNYSLTKAEFDAMFRDMYPGADNPENRKDFLDQLMTRKLLLLEAQRIGLDKEPRFLKSIESFWEQSLLKIIVSKKVEEISREILVTDEDIQACLAQAEQTGADQGECSRELILWKMRMQKQEEMFDNMIDNIRKGVKIKIDKDKLGIE